MFETSKAVMRRLHDSRYATRYFVGHGIDIGSGPDPLSNYGEFFPLMCSCRDWDIKDGDAQVLDSLADESLDFVHSSHCLEHMRDPREALHNWLRILKPGGHLIVTIPDEDLYEQGVFPSSWNPDHKWTFTIFKNNSWSSRSINLLSLLADLSACSAQIIKIEQLDATFKFTQQHRTDQTVTPVGEAALEFIMRKSTSDEVASLGRYPNPEFLPGTVVSIPEALETARRHQNAGRFSEAEGILRRVLEWQPDAEAHKHLGNLLLALGRLEEAEHEYRSALRIDAAYGEAWNNLGNVLRLQLRLEEAESAFLSALALLPGSAEVHNNFGLVLMDRGQIHEAEEHFRKAVVLSPEYFTAYFNRGNALLALGRREAAEKSYRRAITLKPDYVQAHVGLGQALVRTGLSSPSQQHKKRKKPM